MTTYTKYDALYNVAVDIAEQYLVNDDDGTVYIRVDNEDDVYYDIEVTLVNKGADKYLAARIADKVIEEFCDPLFYD